jgi:hypothetical protein
MILARTTTLLLAPLSQYIMTGGPPTCATPLRKPETAPTPTVSQVFGVSW